MNQATGSKSMDPRIRVSEIANIFVTTLKNNLSNRRSGGGEQSGLNRQVKQKQQYELQKLAIEFT